MPPLMHEYAIKQPESYRRSFCYSLLKVYGGLDGVIKYMDNCRDAYENAPRIGFQCPREGVECKSVTFDNITVFYHPTFLEEAQPKEPSWNFYIAPAGGEPQSCINWRKAGIQITGCTLVGDRVDYSLLVAQPGAEVRIEYGLGDDFAGPDRRVRDLVFPMIGKAPKDGIPIHYIE